MTRTFDLDSWLDEFERSREELGPLIFDELTEEDFGDN